MLRKQSKNAISLVNISKSGQLQEGDVLISSFLPYASGQGSEKKTLQFNSQAEEQGL